jgi:hypothetical protein
MTGKGKAMEDVRALGNVKATEKVNQVIQDKGTDIAESLAQGEDRGGFKANLKPYCHRCFSKGNSKEACTVLLVCDICSSQMLKMCCNIGAWVWDHILYEAWLDPLGVPLGWGIQDFKFSEKPSGPLLGLIVMSH